MTSASAYVSGIEHNFSILKSNDLHIAGYASIEMVDKQNDLITLEALNEAVKKYMKDTKYRNVMSNHSNVQVGEVVKEYRDNNGRLWKTDVDDVGFFVVIKMRSDIEKAKEIAREIRTGNLRSFSIGGQALEKKSKTNVELGEYNEISKLDLHEVTICEKGINPEAKFDILKQEKGENMTDIASALKELNTVLKGMDDIEKFGTSAPTALKAIRDGKNNAEVKSAFETDMANMNGNEVAWSRIEKVADHLGMDRKQTQTLIASVNKDLIVKQGENMKKEEYLDDESEIEAQDDEEDIEMASSEETNEMPDIEAAEKADLAYGSDVQGSYAGKEVVSGGKAKARDSVHKEVYDGVSTLDLSHENLEKAYEQFKAEQLEKMAYDDIKNTFESRFQTEVSVKKSEIEKTNYDAKSEVDALKNQFGDLLKSLKNEQETVIRKQEEVVANLNIPTSDEIAKMDWNEIHLVAQRLNGEL
jgi:HK97 family phage prohead protease